MVRASHNLEKNLGGERRVHHRTLAVGPPDRVAQRSFRRPPGRRGPMQADANLRGCGFWARCALRPSLAAFIVVNHATSVHPDSALCSLTSLLIISNQQNKKLSKYF